MERSLVNPLIPKLDLKRKVYTEDIIANGDDSPYTRDQKKYRRKEARRLARV